MIALNQIKLQALQYDSTHKLCALVNASHHKYTI